MCLLLSLTKLIRRKLFIGTSVTREPEINLRCVMTLRTEAARKEAVEHAQRDDVRFSLSFLRLLLVYFWQLRIER